MLFEGPPPKQISPSDSLATAARQTGVLKHFSVLVYQEASDICRFMFLIQNIILFLFILMLIL